MHFKDYDTKLFKTKRLVCEVTLQELADICHTTRQTISNIETGKSHHYKTTETLIGLALDGLAEEKGLTALFDKLEH